MTVLKKKFNALTLTRLRILTERTITQAFSHDIWHFHTEGCLYEKWLTSLASGLSESESSTCVMNKI